MLDIRRLTQWVAEDMNRICWNPAVIGKTNEDRDQLEERRKDDEDVHLQQHLTLIDVRDDFSWGAWNKYG